MKVQEPRPSRFDLRWRLFGVPVRIDPLFWMASVLLGVRYYVDPDGGSFGWFLFWLVAVFVSVLVHELGHVFVGRLLGMRGEVILGGFGGLTLGSDALPRPWQRIAVLLGGPLVQLLIVAAIWSITFIPFPTVLHERGWDGPIATGTAMVLWINYYWALLNLLPLWPLDGGRVACEFGAWLAGVRGKRAALGLCLVAAALLAIWVTLELSVHLNDPFDPRYLIWLLQFGVWLPFCFLFWVRTFRALWFQPQAS